MDKPTVPVRETVAQFLRVTQSHIRVPGTQKYRVQADSFSPMVATSFRPESGRFRGYIICQKILLFIFHISDILVEAISAKSSRKKGTASQNLTACHSNLDWLES